jgi:ATP-dependent Lhr-like helicase
MDARVLKDNLPRTWGAFFGRYGSFTSAQAAASPLLLEGKNVILCAATASGKTAAALAPLIERHLPPTRSTSQLAILYLLPTRALINDLANRLAPPLETLRVTAAVKTRDLDTFQPKRPADLLFTTPESLDALIATQPKTLASVQAVIIDELHVFDGNVRGDQLRVLLNRLRQVRTHAHRVGDAPDGQMQYVALSATLAQPAEAAARYFPDAHVVLAPGERTFSTELIALEADSPDALLRYLQTFFARGWRKALAFCNTRSEVEAYATALRSAGSPFGDAVFVHYSNLEGERRRDIEQQFTLAEAAICFASSTLELGIDIGNIDIALLIGAPGSIAAYVQRIGRANRRQSRVQAACFYRNPLERLLFQSLAGAQQHHGAPTPFLPSVAIQQIFSLLKQSPTAALRLNPLIELFAGMLSPPDVEAILKQLKTLGYLADGRMGEWRAGKRLHRLADLQGVEDNPLSLYSNLQTSDTTKLKIRDQRSQRIVARVDRQWLDRDVLTLEGRPLQVAWFDGEALWVGAHYGPDPALPLRYLSTRQLLSFELAQQLPAQLGLAPGAAPILQCDDGWLVFHWLGDVYGQALLDLLRYTVRAEATTQPGLCVLLRDEPRALPVLPAEKVKRYLLDEEARFENMLALGAYHHLLPRNLRRSAVVEQFNIPRFVEAVATLRTAPALARLIDILPGLLAS